MEWVRVNGIFSTDIAGNPKQKRNASDPASNSQYTNINDHHARHEVVLDDSVSSV